MALDDGSDDALPSPCRFTHLEYDMPKARTVVPGLKKRHLRAAINAARAIERMKAAPTEVKVQTPAGEKRTESSKEPPKSTT